MDKGKRYEKIQNFSCYMERKVGTGAKDTHVLFQFGQRASPMPQLVTALVSFLNVGKMKVPWLGSSPDPGLLAHCACAIVESACSHMCWQ